MPIYVEMPKLSDTMTEGTLVRWVKQPGETVDVGDVVAEVETDKATMEMEAFDPGVIHKHLVEEGAKVPLGENIYVLLEEGEDAPGDDEPPPAKEKAPASTEESKSEESAPAPEAAPKASEPATVPAQEGERVKASPLARKIAEATGVDLHAVTGSGPGGRIVKADVEGAQGKPSTPSPAPATTPSVTKEDQRIALSGMRRVIAQRLLESKTTIPHFYATIEIDAAPMMQMRGSMKALGEGSGVEKVTFNDFVLRAAALAAAAVPQANASFTEDAIIQYGNVHLSVAVAVDDGLVTPVLRNAESMPIAEISRQVKDLASRARSKKLKPDEYQGGTITVSNLGAFGIEEFNAIINPPQSMILAVGAIVKKPVVNASDEIVPGQRMRLTLSGDHRVVDGAVGAEYLAKVKQLLEEPLRLLI